MTLTELRYIVTLAREKHFGHAAERCHVSQPTLSVAVRKLEDELGVPLSSAARTAFRSPRSVAGLWTRPSVFSTRRALSRTWRKTARISSIHH